MKILVCGGDERSAYLCRALCEAGHEVAALCLENAALPPECRLVNAPERAQVVILPVPACRDTQGELLNAPLGVSPCPTADILDAAGEGALVIGGRLDERITRAAHERGQRVRDYMLMPEFTAKNAAVTAEGAVCRLMDASDAALCDERVLVIGWGRIGKLLMQKLAALGASVCLMSSHADSRAMAQALGYPALAPKSGRELLQGFDAVINTAPAPVISELCAFREGCRIFELASAPGGIDAHEALAAGLKYTALPALPGKYAPRSAARAVFCAVTEILKESGEND